MKRKFTVFILAVTSASLWSIPAVSTDFYNGQSAASNYYGGYYDPAGYWPQIAHEPAITKTLSAMPNISVQQAPSSGHSYDWQNQPALTAPTLALPQFSYPQQGYYPREEIQPQIAPGYEYDFGGGSSYPPAYPIEGAKWKALRTVGFGGAAQITQEEYAHCPL